MEITLDKHSANQASIKISLKEADYQPKVGAKLKDFAKKSNIKGFRPGKAPLSMVKSMYGTSILVEEINSILSESLNSYLKEQTFKILGDPLPQEQKDPIDWKAQKDFDFEYKIGFVESVELPLDSKIKASKYSIKVDDKLVDETITNLKTQFGNSTNPEVSAEGDNIYGDLKTTDEVEFEKNVSLDLTKITKKLAGKFIGLSKEAVVEFDAKDIKKGQWEEAFGLTEEESAAAEGPLTFTVKNINRKEIAEMNQKFFDKIFGPDQVSSEEEFKAKVKETLQSNYDRESKVFTEEELKKVLIEKAKVDLPEAFLKEWLLIANDGKVTTEDIEKEYPMYANQLTWSLISNHIATENNVKAEHEEVIEKTKQMVREQFAASGLGSQMEDSMDMFVDNYLKGEEGQNYINMLTSIQNEKVLAFAVDKVSIKEKELSINEFKELLEK